MRRLAVGLLMLSACGCQTIRTPEDQEKYASAKPAGPLLTAIVTPFITSHCTFNPKHLKTPIVPNEDAPSTPEETTAASPKNGLLNILANRQFRRCWANKSKNVKIIKVPSEEVSDSLAK